MKPRVSLKYFVNDCRTSLKANEFKITETRET